jgi:hypothetical protein
VSSIINKTIAFLPSPSQWVFSLDACRHRPLRSERPRIRLISRLAWRSTRASSSGSPRVSEVAASFTARPSKSVLSRQPGIARGRCVFRPRPKPIRNASLRLFVSRSEQNQIRDFLRVRHERYVTRTKLNGRRVHALGQKSLEFRIDGAVFS